MKKKIEEMEDLTMSTDTFIMLVKTQAKLQIEKNKEMSLNDVMEFLLDHYEGKK